MTAPATPDLREALGQWFLACGIASVKARALAAGLAVSEESPLAPILTRLAEAEKERDEARSETRKWIGIRDECERQLQARFAEIGAELDLRFAAERARDTACAEVATLQGEVARKDEALNKIVKEAPQEDPGPNSEPGLGYLFDDPDEHFDHGVKNGRWRSALIARAALKPREAGHGQT